jgi:hypothetical protein
MTDGSEGQRFSLVYGRRGEPSDDSPRMRRRIAALIERYPDNQKEALAQLIEREHGVEMSPYVSGFGGGHTWYLWNEFLVDAELRDVLDLISTATGVIVNRQKWIEEVRRIFAEEHVRYRVDNAGGVRFAIDESFEGGNAATISALGGKRYATTLATFETALTALVAIPPRGKDAVRDVFSAAEGLFRLIFPKTPRLGADEITTHLRPVVEKRFADPAARGAALKSLRSFREWVDAAHFYRHEPNHAEPNEPPLELAVLLVSSGAGWIRWLAEIDPGAAS